MTGVALGVVLGIGNEFLQNDGVGVAVAAESVAATCRTSACSPSTASRPA
jgi:hypothetical protein